LKKVNQVKFEQAKKVSERLNLLHLLVSTKGEIGKNEEPSYFHPKHEEKIVYAQ
jgi:hypothetical protein